MRNLPVLIALIFFSFNTPKTNIIHSNVVAHVLIDNYHNDLYAEVYFKKDLFTMALLQEESCAPENMVKVCGNSYAQQHINMTLNDEPLTFENQSVNIEKDYVIYRYFLGSSNGKIQKIEVESDYMLKYDDHSVTKLRIKIDELEKHYSLKAERKKITLALN